MAFENKLGNLDGPFVASADLSGKQYYIVKLHTVEGQVALAAADTDTLAGVLQNKPKSSEAAAVSLVGGGGITKCVVDGSGTAIAIGDVITSDSGGKGIKATAGAGKFALGTALQAATGSADVISVLMGVPLKNPS